VSGVNPYFFREGDCILENSQSGDIGRLSLQIGLDQTKYKVFRSETRTFLAISAGQEFDEELTVAQGPLAEAFVEAADERVGKPRLIEAARAALIDQPQPDEQEWTALESLLNLHAAHTTGRPGSERDSVQELPGTTIFGACGGVGSTTIIAALGRISARAGHPVLLIDSATPSFLPLWFGAQSPRSYTSTFTTSGQPGQRPVHISCGNPEEVVRTFASEIDRFYVDGGLFRTIESSPQSGSRRSLMVVIPDARCLAELNRLSRQPMKLPFLLLNQFDHRQPLHREIRSLLDRQFGDLLIPVAISHDSDVSVALAQGTTIVDYAPGSAATSDLYKLNEWLAIKSSNAPKSGNAPSFELTAAGRSL
jgi:hypothetical protein